MGFVNRLEEHSMPSFNEKILKLFPKLALGKVTTQVTEEVQDLGSLPVMDAMPAYDSEINESDFDIYLEELFDTGVEHAYQDYFDQQEKLKGSHANELTGWDRKDWEDGTTEEGEFKEGLLNGLGRITRQDGTVIEGEFIDGELNGHGKICWQEGVIEEGDFKEGLLHGWGKMIGKDGSVLEGQFRQGIYQSASYFIQLKAE